MALAPAAKVAQLKMKFRGNKHGYYATGKLYNHCLGSYQNQHQIHACLEKCYAPWQREFISRHFGLNSIQLKERGLELISSEISARHFGRLNSKYVQNLVSARPQIVAICV